MIKRRPRAIYAIIDAAEYIGRNSPAAAERFLDAVETSLARLEEMPGLGRRYDSPTQSLRACAFGSSKDSPST